MTKGKGAKIPEDVGETVRRVNRAQRFISGASRYDNPEQWVSGGHERFETPVTAHDAPGSAQDKGASVQEIAPGYRWRYRTLFRRHIFGREWLVELRWRNRA